MSLLGKVFGNPLGGVLDDKAERAFANKVGNAAMIFASCVGLALIIVAFRCG